VLISSVTITPIFADTTWDAPGNKNPIVPGYFADATLEKFGDTFYLYATTGGVKNAAHWSLDSADQSDYRQ
jgi:hypothetical protein